MANKLFQNHWFDKDILKILNRYGLQEEAAQKCLDRAASLAQISFRCSVSMVILADFQSYRVKSEEGLSAETTEKLFDLAHLLKEVEHDHWESFSTMPFFRESEMWSCIQEYQFFYCQSITNAEGNTLGWLCLFDKKERKADQTVFQSLKTMTDMVLDELELRMQVRRSNRLENDIIHLAAHDLKNPLSGILGITDHLTRKLDDAGQVEEICSLIKDSSKRMLTILDDILQSGHLENGKIQLKLAPLKLKEVVEHVVLSNREAALRKQQSISIKVLHDPIALIDRHRMVEILDNLVNNAVKYSPRQRPIEISITEKDGRAIFTIYNQGVGLSDADKERIFNKFCRLSAKPTGGEGSTGLGLSIVKMLTEMHGGTIEAISEGLDQGVTFVMEIPSVTHLAA